MYRMNRIYQKVSEIYWNEGMTYVYRKTTQNYYGRSLLDSVVKVLNLFSLFFYSYI